MAELFSQYTSGLQFSAGTITGSVTGASGLNPIVDRLNSISNDNGIYSNLGSGTGIDINAGSVVALRNKTSYLSLNGTEFLPTLDDASWTRDTTGVFTTDAGIVQAIAPVHLPHGAVVTECIVYSNDSTETWSLAYHPINSDGTQNFLATANMNTADSSISDPIIDNSTRRYTLKANNQDSGDTIRGALITYTTDYD